MARRFALFILFALCAAPAFAQSAADGANKSDNPLNVVVSFNLQNYFTPSLFGVNGHTNDFLLRPTVPLGPNSLTPVPEIFRVTVHVSTRPDPAGDHKRTAALGALIQWQHSFAGQSDRPTVQSLLTQPFLIWNLPEGWYIRSTGIWTSPA